MATMPSSPPRRIHARPSSSRRSSNSSQYSFDLDALMPPDEHDSSSIVIQHPNKNAIDVVDSEDIDGPTDFTQNMEYWMSTKLPTVVEPTRLEGAPKQDMEEYIGSDDTESTTKRVPIKRDSPLEEPLELSPNHEFEADRSNMSMATPRHTYDGGLSDSFFNDVPHGDEGTPRTVEPASPPSRPVTRQATVEDYEDTPVRPRDSPAASSIPETIFTRSPEPIGPSETEKALEIALNQLREELASVRKTEDSWQKKYTESTASYENKLAVMQSQAGDAGIEQARQLDHLDTVNKQKDARISALEARVSDQDEKLEEAQREIVTLGRELESMEERYRVAHEDLQALEVEKTSLQKEVSTMQENHDVLQANANKLEQAVQDLEVQAECATNDQLRELQRAYQILQGRHTNLEETVHDLEEQIKCAENEHVEQGRESEAALRQEIAKLQEEYAALRASAADRDTEHNHDISTIEAEAEETISNARDQFLREKEGLETELDTAREEMAALRTETVAMNNELESLRLKLKDQSSTSAQTDMLTKERDLILSKFKEQKSKHAKSQMESHSTISTLQTKIKDLTDVNTSLKKTLQETTKDLSKSRQMAKIAEFETNAALREKQKASIELEMMIEKTEAINAQFDKAVNDMMRGKEREWRARFEALKKERGIMGKVLMKEWGEKECGVMEPVQGYRYKYV
jgi:DNA repair exonuclease SbcCD ATPase subunit